MDLMFFVNEKKNYIHSYFTAQCKTMATDFPIKFLSWNFIETKYINYKLCMIRTLKSTIVIFLFYLIFSTKQK